MVLDSDLRVRRLNARHRGRNKPTNVLTFDYAQEPVVMRVRLPTKLGVQNVTEILVQNSGGTKSVLDTMTTQVSPSWTT